MSLFGANDITFCANYKQCPLAHLCRRAQIPKDDPWLAMSPFKPGPDGKCEHLLDRRK